MNTTASKLLSVFGPLATIVALYLLWEGVEVIWGIPRYLFATPSETFLAIRQNASPLFLHTLATLKIILIGFVASIVIAVPLAFAVVEFRWVERTLYPILLVIQLVPKTIVAPLLLVWFGIGTLPKSGLVMLMTFFPIFLESMAGFKYIDRRVFFISQSMGASRRQELFMINIPSAMPSIFSGMRTAIVYAVTGAITAEFIGSNEGIGYMILSATSNQDMPLTFAGVVASALLGVVLSALMSSLEKILMPWIERR